MSVIWKALLIPFLGTTLGSACVFGMRREMRPTLQKSLLGFAAGVMVAASVWSLILPAFRQTEKMGVWSFVPVSGGFWIGILFLLLLDRIIPHLHLHSEEAEGPHSRLGKTSMLVLAVTLHNLPEGMAVGVVLAGMLAGEPGMTAAGALALAIGIGIQNFPEGAVISMPLRSEGKTPLRAFLSGTASGIVEPIGAALTLFLARTATLALPWMLSFAAGAMMYVVVEELVPEMSEGNHSDAGVLMFAFGFSLMMVLDVLL